MVDGCAPGKGLKGADGSPDGGRSPLSRPGAKAPPSYLGYLSCQPEGSGTLDSPGGQPKAAPRASPCELKRSGAPTGRRNRRGLCLRSAPAAGTRPALQPPQTPVRLPTEWSGEPFFYPRIVRKTQKKAPGLESETRGKGGKKREKMNLGVGNRPQQSSVASRRPFDAVTVSYRGNRRAGAGLGRAVAGWVGFLTHRGRTAQVLDTIPI